MFDIREMPVQVDVELVERALHAEPATIGHFRLTGIPDGAIRPLFDVPRIAGTAVTLALPAADSTLLHHCVGLLRRGDILVIDRLGDQRHACLGGGVALALKRMQIAGIIIDGLCADPRELREHDLPIWGRGFSAITTRLLGIGGLMNIPVSVGGAVVMPGDLIIADEGGIVVLPPIEASAAIERAVTLQSKETEGLAKVGRDFPLGAATGASALVELKLAPALTAPSGGQPKSSLSRPAMDKA